jgi:hypothetical protein
MPELAPPTDPRARRVERLERIRKARSSLNAVKHNFTRRLLVGLEYVQQPTERADHLDSLGLTDVPCPPGC